jgi:hypothetical protein
MIDHYTDAIAKSIPVNTSIHSMITAAVRSHYGDACPESLKQRGLGDGEVLVHPLMTMAFWFDAHRVVANRLFVSTCSQATSLRDLDLRFDAARKQAGLIDERGCYLGKRPYSRAMDQVFLTCFSRT